MSVSLFSLLRPGVSYNKKHTTRQVLQLHVTFSQTAKRNKALSSTHLHWHLHMRQEASISTNQTSNHWPGISTDQMASFPLTAAEAAVAYPPPWISICGQGCPHKVQGRAGGVDRMKSIISMPSTCHRHFRGLEERETKGQLFSNSTEDGQTSPQ